jgi:hypothetical protein
VGELLRVRVEFVETFARTESILTAGEDLGVAATRLDLHPAYRIFR